MKTIDQCTTANDYYGDYSIGRLKEIDDYLTHLYFIEEEHFQAMSLSRFLMADLWEARRLYLIGIGMEDVK